MFTYNIAKDANRKAFNYICNLIESKLEGIENKQLLEDVDGTQIKIFETRLGEIKVYNDYDVGAVYVDSEFDLKEIIK